MWGLEEIKNLYIHLIGIQTGASTKKIDLGSSTKMEMTEYYWDTCIFTFIVVTYICQDTAPVYTVINKCIQW